MKYNDKGEEINDMPAVEIPLRLRRPPSRAEEIMRAVRGALSEVADSRGRESFEEANDFEVPDEEELVLSGYQATLMKHEALQARDADRDYLDAIGVDGARRRARIDARLEKEGRDNDSRTDSSSGGSGDAGVEPSGGRSGASGRTGDGVLDSKGDGGSGGAGARAAGSAERGQGGGSA